MVDSMSEIKKNQGFDLDLWPWIDLSSEFLLENKQTLPVGTYIWDMIEKYTKYSII